MSNVNENNNLMETLYLCSIPNMQKSIIDGLNTSVEDCVEIDWKADIQAR